VPGTRCAVVTPRVTVACCVPLHRRVPPSFEFLGPRLEVRLSLQRPLLAEEEHRIAVGDVALRREVYGFKDGGDQVVYFGAGGHPAARI